MPEVENIGRRSQPAARAALTSAHLQFIRECYVFLSSAEGTLTGIGRVMPYVLYIRLLQQARALTLLVTAGYPDDAELIARAMTLTATSLVAIVDGDSDARALRFLAHSQRLRRQKLDGYVRQGYVSAEDARAWDAKVGEGEAKVLEGYREHGVEPRGLGPGGMFWHGLTETQLFRQMNAERWLDLFYVPFSEEVHSTVGAVAGAIRQLTQEGSVRLGPTYARAVGRHGGDRSAADGGPAADGRRHDQCLTPH